MFDCIMLAAGASSRMGTWKLLLPWKDRTVVEAAVDQGLSSDRRVILVAGYRSDELAKHFAGRENVLVVAHDGWRKGQFTSLQRGILEVKTDAFFVALADMPGVNRELYAGLEALRNSAKPKSDRPRAFRPGSPDRPGHPVLFDTEAIPLILGLDPASSMRNVFPLLELTWMPTPDQGAFDDLDAPQDYERLTRN